MTLDIEVFLLMRAAITLFVFRVSTSFCKNVGFLVISFSMVENRALECVRDIHHLSLLICWSSFASLVFPVFVDTVEDMLVDLAQFRLFVVERFLARDFVCYCDVL